MAEEAAINDLYRVLEIEPDVRPEMIRRAYFRLAKLYHPDLADAGSMQDCTERFIAIQEAYEILSDVNRREAYDAARRTAGKGPMPPPGKNDDAKGTSWSSSRKPTLDEEKDARKAYARVNSLIETQELDRACEVLRIITKTVPDEPEYESKYGYVLGLLGRTLHKARDLCRRAVEADPYNADFHAHLGFVYQRAGLSKTANECFREALALDPTHPVAFKHLQSGKQEKGWLGKLGGLLKR